MDTSRNRFIIKIEKKEMLWFFAAIAIYRVLLEISYVKLISPAYSYMGLVIENTGVMYAVSWLLTLLPILSVINLYKDISFCSTILYLLYLICFVPSMVLFGYIKAPFVGWFLLYYFLLFFFNRVIRDFNIPNGVKLDKRGMNILMLIFILVIVFVWGRYSHFRINFSLLDVYDRRNEASFYNIPTIIGYIFSGIKLVLPTLTVWALSNNNKMLALIYAGTEMVTFFIDGSKSVVVSLVVAIFAYLVIKKKKELIKYSVVGLILFLLVGLLENAIFHSIYIDGIFVRRALFIPQRLNYFYYEYISQHGPDFFRQGLIGRLGFQSRYPQRITNIIGGIYFGNASNSANNGLFSDAYYNLGYAGFIILPLMIIILLKILDSCSRDQLDEVRIASVIAISISLISSSFFTILLTHGGIFLAIIFLLLPRNLEKSSSE